MILTALSKISDYLKKHRALTRRGIDTAIAGCLLGGLFPILTVAAVSIRITMGKPVLFRQKRPGRNGVPFELIKFRTMNVLSEAEQAKTPDRERQTRIGRWLRETSIDELPELINVFMGDMSFVGPRPLLMRYYPYFTERERLRFKVRPGITGWAQVNGRSNVPWNERLEMDAWYVENQSWRLDIKIVILTILKVLRRENTQFLPNEHLKFDLDIERQMKLEKNNE